MDLSSKVALLPDFGVFYATCFSIEIRGQLDLRAGHLPEWLWTLRALAGFGSCRKSSRRDGRASRDVIIARSQSFIRSIPTIGLVIRASLEEDSPDSTPISAYAPEPSKSGICGGRKGFRIKFGIASSILERNARR